MEKKNPNTKDEIILPKNLQMEMMKFFLRTSILKIAERNSIPAALLLILFPPTHIKPPE
jgi:hypothetical protein